jgi:hypothetical protein
MSRQKEEAPDFGPEPHSEVAQWVKRVFDTLQTRVADPVEQAEREAHFETHKQGKT